MCGRVLHSSSLSANKHLLILLVTFAGYELRRTLVVVTLDVVVDIDIVVVIVVDVMLEMVVVIDDVLAVNCCSRCR